jgi:plastocyanin
MDRIFASFILFVSATAGTLTALAAGGMVTGHVVITKTMTKKRVTLPAYELRGVPVNTSNSNPSPTSNPSVDELARVIVYLEGPGLKSSSPAVATLAQRKRRFDPEILVVPVGSTVSFPNDDPIFHNVFSLSKVKQFDLGYYPAGQTRTVKFDKPGIVQVYCHIHPDMSAAIVILSTPFWAHPESGGQFNFPNVPPGNYDLVAWHRSAGFFRRHITVTEGATTDENFVIPVKDNDSSVSSHPGGSQ